MGNLFDELKRRNVFRVGIAYLVVGWVLVQVAGTLEEALSLPQWFDTVVVAFLALGLPVALFLSWAYEMTPGGVMKTEDVEAAASLTPSTGRKLNLAIIAALMLALGYFVWEARFGGPPDAADAPESSEAIVAEVDRSIAVLPFVNLSSDPEQEYFSDGMTEEILNALAKIKEMRVAARTSAFEYKGQNLDLREVGRKLGVGHILEGSVRKAGNTVRITAQLIEVNSGFHLWSETYDRELENIFALQDEISLAIADAMSITLNIAATPAATSRTRNLESYDLYLRSLAIYRSRQDLTDGVALLRRAVELDPDFALAWAMLAQTLQVMHIYMPEDQRLSGDERVEMWLKARQAAEIAYGLTPDLPRALHAMGATDKSALAEHGYYRRALDLDPSNAELMEDLVGSLFSMGLTQQAVDLAERMVALDAIGVNILAYAMALTGNGDYQAAILQFERGATLAPQLGPILWFGLHAYLLAGDLDGMEAHIAKFETTLPEFSAEYAEKLAIIRGHLAENDRYTTDLTKAFDNDRVLVMIAAQAGEQSLVTEIALEGAAFGNLFDMSWIFTDLRFAPLRQSPEFHAALREAGYFAFWQEFGFPTNCHAVGDDDFTCE